MTDETPPLPPAGWYPDPERPDQLRYWTGTQWWTQRWDHPEVEAGIRQPRPVGRGFQRLGVVARLGLRLVVMVLLARVALYVWGLTMIEEAVATGDIGRLEDFDNLDLALGVVGVTALCATAVCWALWQYLLARSADREQLTRGAGWHAFSWIVPIVSLWFPFQNVRDLWRRRFPERSNTLIGWWWAGWISLIVLDRMYRASYAEVDGVSEFRGAIVLGIVDTVIGAVTAALAVHINRSLSDAERSPAVSSEETRVAW